MFTTVSHHFSFTQHLNIWRLKTQTDSVLEAELFAILLLYKSSVMHVMLCLYCSILHFTNHDVLKGDRQVSLALSDYAAMLSCYAFMDVQVIHAMVTNTPLYHDRCWSLCW